MFYNKNISVNSPQVQYDEARKYLNVLYDYSHTKANRLPSGVINVSFFLYGFKFNKHVINI